MPCFAMLCHALDSSEESVHRKSAVVFSSLLIWNGVADDDLKFRMHLQCYDQSIAIVPSCHEIALKPQTCQKS